MRHYLALTMGDAAGIGPEIIIKALAEQRLYERCIPVVIGDRAPLEDAIRFCHSPLTLNTVQQPQDARGEYGTVDLIDLGLLRAGGWQYKTVCRASGEASFQYIVKGIELAMARQVDGVVTGPINKEAINLAGHHYSGHTEIFAEYTHTDNYGMLLLSKSLRVIHVTTHMSMRNACDLIRENPDRVAWAIRLAQEAMEQLGIGHPRIAVAGLNPHAGENGLFGREELDEIIPAIRAAQDEGLCVDGPVPPDSLFPKALGGWYDIVVAMYHDQGHIPLKTVGFVYDREKQAWKAVEGVNITLGLPIIRTSVDHGTGFDQAGKGTSNELSLLNAIQYAVTMARNRNIKE